MSLILEALNRAERERNKTSPIPDLHTVHEPVPVTKTAHGKNRGLIYAAFFLGLLIFLSVAFYTVLRDRAPAANLDKTAVPSLAVESPALVSPSAPDAIAFDSPTTDSRASVPVVSESMHSASMPDKTIAPQLSAQTEQESAQRLSASSSSVADLAALYASAHDQEEADERAVDKLYQTPAPAAPAMTKVTTSDAPVPVNLAEVRNYASLIDLPDIGDLPWNLRQQIPSINYVRHNFTGEAVAAGRSSVVINSRAHYPGDAVATDVLLEEIIVDGIILRFKQTRFKLRALNSWINM